MKKVVDDFARPIGDLWILELSQRCTQPDY
jgi:hypothetical protein